MARPKSLSMPPRKCSSIAWRAASALPHSMARSTAACPWHTLSRRGRPARLRASPMLKRVCGAKAAIVMLKKRLPQA